MTTVTENLDRARKIRDERKAKMGEYVAALEELETNLELLLLSGSGADGAKVRVSLGKIKGLRAQIGGRK